jgi:hypothetical protein
MSNSDDLTARRARELRALAELGMAKARTVQRRMLASKASDMAALAAEFEQAARAVRAAITAEAELERRRRQALRARRERVRPPRPLIPDPESRTVH